MPASSASSRSSRLRSAYERAQWPRNGASISAEETGSSFEENALLKARHAAAAARLAALADDSGLEVDALGGRPGVLLSPLRWRRGHGRGEQCAAAGRARLTARERRARRATAACSRWCARPGIARRCWPRQLGRTHRAAAAGNGGFGYDPVFIPQGYEQTVAQLPAALKQRLSHRALAAASLVGILRGV